MSAELFQQLAIPLVENLLSPFRLEVKGSINLKGFEKEPLIFAPNHSGYLDGFIVATALEELLPIFFIVNKKYLSAASSPLIFPLNHVCASVLKHNEAIPIGGEKGIEFRSVIKKIICTLEEGKKICIFPEQYFSPDGKMQSVKKGVVLLHQKSHVPVVPIGIVGAHSSQLHRFKIVVSIGKPIINLYNKEALQSEIYKLL